MEIEFSMKFSLFPNFCVRLVSLSFWVRSFSSARHPCLHSLGPGMGWQLSNFSLSPSQVNRKRRKLFSPSPFAFWFEWESCKWSKSDADRNLRKSWSTLYRVRHCYSCINFDPTRSWPTPTELCSRFSSTNETQSRLLLSLLLRTCLLVRHRKRFQIKTVFHFIALVGNAGGQCSVPFRLLSMWPHNFLIWKRPKVCARNDFVPSSLRLNCQIENMSNCLSDDLSWLRSLGDAFIHLNIWHVDLLETWKF